MLFVAQVKSASCVQVWLATKSINKTKVAPNRETIRPQRQTMTVAISTEKVNRWTVSPLNKTPSIFGTQICSLSTNDVLLLTINLPFHPTDKQFFAFLSSGVTGRRCQQPSSGRQVAGNVLYIVFYNYARGIWKMTFNLSQCIYEDYINNSFTKLHNKGNRSLMEPHWLTGAVSVLWW